MTLGNTPESWGAVSKLLHWAIVLMILGQFTLALLADRLPLGIEKIALLSRHKSLGITILGLALLRLAWRAAFPVPALPAHTKPVERSLARGTHVALYGLLIAMPLSGWLMSSARNFPVSWFGIVQLPDLISPGDAAYRAMHETHEAIAALLLLVALLHVAGALKHHFIYRDNVLRRMLPVVAVLSVLGCALATAAAPSAVPAAAPAAAPKKLPTVAHKAVPTARFLLDPAASALEFSFMQAGATSKGRFLKFSAELNWAGPTALDRSQLVVSVQSSSIDTQDTERDNLLRGSDLFASDRYPTARFVSSAFATTGPGRYAIRGTLTIRDRARPATLSDIELRFVTEAGREVAYLNGNATLRRLDFGVGQGEWQSTEWVGNEIRIQFRTRLPRAP